VATLELIRAKKLDVVERLIVLDMKSRGSLIQKASEEKYSFVLLRQCLAHVSDLSVEVGKVLAYHGDDG
jgi:hypothetical protein